MKRLLALVLLLALVGAASATSLNFQNPVDYTQLNFTHIGSDGEHSWISTTNAQNNYIMTGLSGTGNINNGVYFTLYDPNPSTYAAATYLGGGNDNNGWWPTVYLLSSTRSVLYSYGHTNVGTSTGRYEVKVSGGTAYVYRNGVLLANSTPLAQNPSFIGFGCGHASYFAVGQVPRAYFDDYVYGQTENKFVLGLPETDNNAFFILNDIMNNAYDGVYNSTSSTQTDANYMYGQWSRGNVTVGADVDQPNMSIQLVTYPDNTVYSQFYTGTGYTGSITADIKTYLIDANAPDGYYAFYMPGAGAYSNIILKKSNGATVAFDSETYSTNDVATITHTVAAGGYWDSAYTYRLSIYGLSDGYVANTSITTQTGSSTHSWTSSNTPGVYYAILYAISSTGQEYILGLDWATLSSYAGYAGYVNNAQTGATIEGAFVNMTQDGVSGNSTSGFDGNWSSGSVFSTGSILMLNATASGYIPYNYSWTPLAARTVSDLNVSMVPLAPTYTGLAIGGVDRDFLYGRPISGATVTVRNTTTDLYCYKTTSFTGWYLNDETDCLFQSKTPYDVWAYKIGYTNSTTEQAVTK